MVPESVTSSGAVILAISLLRGVQTLEAGGHTGLPHWAQEEQQEAGRQHAAGRGASGGVGGGWWQEGQTTSLSQATEMSRGDMFVLDWDSHAD